VLADSGPNQNQKPDERTLLASLTIKSISKDIEVCAEVLDTASVPHLNRAGVDQTVVAGEFSGFFLANAVISPGIPQAFREIITVRNGADIRREAMPRDLVGKTFREAAADFMDRDGSLLLGVITERKAFNLESVLSGESGDIDAFIRRKFEEAGRSLEIEAKGRLNVTINPGRDYIISADDLAVVLTPKQAEV
jgi:voltage-gated potassium channel